MDKLTEKYKTEQAALEVLRQTGVDVLEAALVARAAIEAGRGRVRRARECITMGAEMLRLHEKTITFERAVMEALDARRHLRARTLIDFRYFANRLMRLCKGLAKRHLRSIIPLECRDYLHQALDSAT